MQDALSLVTADSAAYYLKHKAIEVEVKAMAQEISSLKGQSEATKATQQSHTQ
jgi:hypothetical protein